MLKINLFLFCAFFVLLYGQILTTIVNSRTPPMKRTNSRKLVRAKNSQPCALYSKNSRDLKAKAFRQHLSRKVRTHHGPHNHNQLTSRVSTQPKIKHHFVRKYPKSNSVDCSKRHVALESYAKRVNLTTVNGTEVSERSVQFMPFIPTLTYVAGGILKRNENQRSLNDVTTDTSQTPRENPFSANKSGLSIEELCASNGFDPKTGSGSMKMDLSSMRTESGLIQTESSSMKTDSYLLKSNTTTGTGKSLKLGQHTTCVAIADDEAGGTSCYPVTEDNEVDNRKVVVNTSTPGQIFAERERLLGATTKGQTTQTDSSSFDNIATTSTITPNVLTPRAILTKVFIIPIQEEFASADLNNTLKSVRIALDSDILNSPNKRSKSSKRTASESGKHKKQKKQHGAKDKTPSKHGKKKKEKRPSKKHDKRKKPEHKHETTTKKRKPSNKGKHEEKKAHATSSHKRKDNKKRKSEHGDKGSDQNKHKSKKHDSKSRKKKDKS